MAEQNERQPRGLPEKPRKLTVPEIIEKAADAAAKRVVCQQHRVSSVNLYRSMERLLRAYPRRVRMAEHPEEFQFFPTGRSKDISIAPPPGTGVVDKVEANELFVEARKRAFEHEMFRLYETEYAIAPFRELEAFVVIRMYYFGEDVHGHDRGDAKPYTFDEISGELASVGIEKSARSLRFWRTKLVQDMTVLLFGIDGAVSVEARDPKRKEGEGQ